MGDEISEQDAIKIWNYRLDDYSLRDICENKFSDYPRRKIVALLAGPVPDQFKEDERLLPFVHQGMAVSGECRDAGGKPVAFLVLRRPRKITNAAFGKGLTRLKQSFRTDFPDATPDLLVAQHLEQSLAANFVAQRGVPGYWLQADGTLQRLAAEHFPASRSRLEPEHPLPGPRGG